MDELFKIGQHYVFYLNYGNKAGSQTIEGQVVAYTHPLVRVQTKGLVRIINCSSTFFIEAISRNRSAKPESLNLEMDRD